MKLLFFLLLNLCSFIFADQPAQAQIRKIPAEVTDALMDKYPNAERVSWKDKLTSFSASFEIDHEKYEARFSDKGEWRSTEKEIDEDELTEEVKDGFEKSKYGDWQIQNVYSIELPGEETQFRILVSKSDVQKKNLIFNSDGKLLKDHITFK